MKWHLKHEVLMEFNFRGKENKASPSFRNKIFEPIKRFSARHIIIEGAAEQLLLMTA